jgi:two-component system response regulator
MNPKIILLVEDNPDDQVLTLRAFKKHKVANTIIIANDGIEALEYLHGTDDTLPKPLPQMVLLDLKLPKLNGLDVLRQIRAHERTRILPVVILTTSKEEQDVFQSYNLGANSYIRKPVDFEHFTEAVDQLGLYWLVLNETIQDLE